MDYALIISAQPRLFLEAKALGGNLNDRRWSHQIMSYASVAGVEWIALTDGNEYRIYNSHATVPVEKKLFRSVSITDQSDKLEETLSLLSKQSILKDEMAILWRSFFIDRTVREKLEQLFGSEPDPSIIHLIAGQIGNLSDKEIRASLERARIRFDFSIDPLFHESTPLSPAPHDSDYAPPILVATNAPTEVTLRGLIDARLVNPPMQLEKLYREQLLTARIETNATVTFNGKAYTSLSMAGKAARISVIGAGIAANTNGWSFWRFKDSVDSSKT